MKLSATDLHNLKTLTTPARTFKGAGRAMRKLIAAGLIELTVTEDNSAYLYTTTEAGKEVS
jgi:hypothetical protein